METAVIGAIAGVFGLVLGRLWDSRSEYTRWRRDQRVASYGALAREFYRLRERYRALEGFLEAVREDLGLEGLPNLYREYALRREPRGHLESPVT